MGLFGKTSKSQGDLHCSFCGKGQAEVAKLIAGPSVYICDKCIDLCNDILADERADANTPDVKARPIIPSGLFCSLCRFPVELGGFVTVPDRGLLCAACVDAIRAVTEDHDADPRTQ